MSKILCSLVCLFLFFSSVTFVVAEEEVVPLIAEEKAGYEGMLLNESLGLDDGILDEYLVETSDTRVEYTRYQGNMSDYIRTYGLAEDKPSFTLRYFDDNGDRLVDRIEMTFSFTGFYQLMSLYREDGVMQKMFLSSDAQLKEMEAMAAAVA